MFTTSGTYPWSLVTQIFHSGQPSYGADLSVSVVAFTFSLMVLMHHHSHQAGNYIVNGHHLNSGTCNAQKNYHNFITIDTTYINLNDPNNVSVSPSVTFGGLYFTEGIFGTDG